MKTKCPFPGCGGNFTSDSGMLNHPENGDYYGNNEVCIWRIKTSVPITITFETFELEQNYDYLYIW